MKTRSIMLLVSAALSLSLSGCLVSNTPLITAANSGRPLPAHFSISRDGSPEDFGEAELSGDNAYVFSDKGDGSNKETVRFKKIAGNLYAASRPLIVQSTGKLTGYQYGYMQVSAGGSRVFIHWPDCRAFDAAEIGKMGVEIVNEDDQTVAECHIPSVEVLGTLIKNYINDPANAETIKSRKDDSTFVIIVK
jgi:hypothetical protein